MIEDDELEKPKHEHPTVALARLEERIKTLTAIVTKFDQTFKEYVTKIEFWPVKAISFGLAGLVLAAVIAALVAKVIK